MTSKTVAAFTRYGTNIAVFFKKYAFLLHVLNKNKNQILSISDLSWTFLKSQKLIPSGKKKKNNLS